ncbi:MAG: AMP-binding protein [Pseudomonadota bacterium]
MAAYVMMAGRETPRKTALKVLDGTGEVVEEWRFADLDRAIMGTAAGLRARGLQPGERVALRMGNLSDFPILFFGTIAAGGIAVPTSAQLTEREFHKLAQDMTPRLIAIADNLALERTPTGAEILPQPCWQTLRGAKPLEETAQTGPDDPAYLIYTSGTSGRPKGVLHAQRAAWARRMMWAGWYGLGATDVMLHTGAFNWTYTLGTGLTDPWAAGASSLIHRGSVDPTDWPDLAARHGATILAATPGLYRQMLRGDGDLSGSFAALRHALTAGEQMPQALSEAWRTRTGRPVYEALGMSEISTFISSSPDTPPRPGAVGHPQPGRRVAVLAGNAPAAIGIEGDLAVARTDPGLMLGYWNQPRETAASQRGDWFITGDLARMDAEGYITHLGRADDVMTALGYRISPGEVEEALSTHPAIAEIAVTEVEIREGLRLIAAFIVADGAWPGEDALADYAQTRLARYKCPRIWQQVAALPRTANGKLQRRKLALDTSTKP